MTIKLEVGKLYRVSGGDRIIIMRGGKHFFMPEVGG